MEYKYFENVLLVLYLIRNDFIYCRHKNTLEKLKLYRKVCFVVS